MTIFDVTKNYEKGAFCVPNELDEVNNIWKEFELWVIPEDVKSEVENDMLILSSMTGKRIEYIEEENIGECDVERKETIDTGTDVQEESAEVENI